MSLDEIRRLPMAGKRAKSSDNPTERVSIFVSTPSPHSRRRSAPLLIRGRSHSLTDEDVVSTFVRRRQKAGLHVQLSQKTPRSLNSSATSLSSLDASSAQVVSAQSPPSPRGIKPFGIQLLQRLGRNKENHGTHSGKEDSEGEDHARSQPNVTIEKHKKQFSQVLAEITERAMSSSLGRRRSKTQEAQTADHRNSADNDSNVRPRGSSSVSMPDQLPRGRSGTTLSLNEQEDSADVDSLDGTFSSHEKECTDEVDGQLIDSEKQRQRLEHLNFKIKKTKDQIRQLQDERDEYVKEYLESTEGSHKSKTLFEKKNQKTNTQVAQLQKKLEKYHANRMELEVNGAAPSGHLAKEVLKGVKENIRGISGGVRDGVKGAVTKPLEIIKHRRFGSAENVSTTASSPGSKTDGLEEDSTSGLIGEDNLAGETNLSSTKYNSDDDSSSVASVTHMSAVAGGSSPRVSQPPSPPSSYDQDIIELRGTNARLQEEIDNLKNQLDLVAKSLQEERCNSEQLRDLLSTITTEWNDVSELRQNEMIAVKQELERAEERIELVEYRSAERASEIEEGLDSYVTRILKIEALQQQNQNMIGLDDYLDQSAQAKALLSKFLTMVLAILQIILIICTTLARIVIPFTRTRFRMIITSMVILFIAVLWRYQESDNVRFVTEYVNGQFVKIGDRFKSKGLIVRTYLKKFYNREDT